MSSSTLHAPVARERVPAFLRNRFTVKNGPRTGTAAAQADPVFLSRCILLQGIGGASPRIVSIAVVRDLFAGITDIIGGRSSSYEASLQEARDTAMAELADRALRAGGNAVVGIDLDYEVVGNSMLMVSASGTSVSLEEG